MQWVRVFLQLRRFYLEFTDTLYRLFYLCYYIFFSYIVCGYAYEKRHWNNLYFYYLPLGVDVFSCVQINRCMEKKLSLLSFVHTFGFATISGNSDEPSNSIYIYIYVAMSCNVDGFRVLRARTTFCRYLFVQLTNSITYIRIHLPLSWCVVLGIVCENVSNTMQLGEYNMRQIIALCLQRSTDLECALSRLNMEINCGFTFENKNLISFQGEM